MSSLAIQPASVPSFSTVVCLPMTWAANFSRCSGPNRIGVGPSMKAEEADAAGEEAHE